MYYYCSFDFFTGYVICSSPSLSLIFLANPHQLKLYHILKTRSYSDIELYSKLFNKYGYTETGITRELGYLGLETSSIISITVIAKNIFASFLYFCNQKINQNISQSIQCK